MAEPRYLDRGTVGCVFYPALPCSPECVESYCLSGESISKLFKKSYEDRMLGEYFNTLRTLRIIDPEHKFSPKGPFLCDINYDYPITPSVKDIILHHCDGMIRNERDLPTQQLIYQYVGKPLEFIINTNPTGKSYLDFVEIFRKIMEILVKINRSGYAFRDLHSKNIVLSGSDYTKVKFIDFDTISSLSEERGGERDDIWGFNSTFMEFISEYRDKMPPFIQFLFRQYLTITDTNADSDMTIPECNDLFKKTANIAELYAKLFNIIKNQPASNQLFNLLAQKFQSIPSTQFNRLLIDIEMAIISYSSIRRESIIKQLESIEQSGRGKGKRSRRKSLLLTSTMRKSYRK